MLLGGKKAVAEAIVAAATAAATGRISSGRNQARWTRGSRALADESS